MATSSWACSPSSRRHAHPRQWACHTPQAGQCATGFKPMPHVSTFNIASYLPQMANSAPEQAAVVVTRSRDHGSRGSRVSTTSVPPSRGDCRGVGGGRYITFAELEARSNRYANGLASVGIARGMRAVVMVRPGIEFVGLIFALFKVGAVPVLIDPGMGVRRMLDCIRMVDVHAFIGIPLAQMMRVLCRRPFRTVQSVVTVGRRWCWGGRTLDELERGGSDEFAAAETSPHEVAAILFTSGSTGPAKGVVYEHGMFDAQVQAIQTNYGIEPGEIDLPTFPLFALFNPAMGMTSVILEMDPSRPAKVDPATVVAAIRDHNVTNTFGSPAIWNRVGAYCVAEGIQLPSLRRILIAGAPVPCRVIEELRSVLSRGADVYTPYGATESLPVSSISGRELVTECGGQSRAGAGTCVGKPLPGIDLRFIGITDEAIDEWSDDLLVTDGEPGEIVVSGPVVTKEYFGQKDATALAKIKDGDRVWHRIGDIGYRDQLGRIWFCGRKSHRVVTENGTMYSVRCEAIFNEHPDVRRSALVGVGPRGTQTPVIVIEPKPNRFPSRSRATAFREELLQLSGANEMTRCIDHVLFHRALPVDVRHNAKINREALAVWAGRRLSR